MNVPTVIAVVGGIALLVGIFGGGVEAEKIKIPVINGKVRLFSAITGIALIVTAALLSDPKIFIANPTSTNLPVSDLSPTETKMEVDVGTITVSSSNSSGTQWCSQISAKYAVEYQSGTYSPWDKDASCDAGCWTTAIYVYKSRIVEWSPQGGDFSPTNPDFKLGWDNRHVKQEDAETIARAENNRFETSLDTGQCLTFIALDGQPNYDGNRGEIILMVKIIGQ